MTASILQQLYSLDGRLALVTGQTLAVDGGFMVS